MAIGSNIRTYHEGTWYQGERAVITSADHGAWLGTTVFDGARLFDGLTPDFQVVIPEFGVVEGPFQVTSLEYSGQLNGEATYELSLASAGQLQFIPYVDPVV